MRKFLSIIGIIAALVMCAVSAAMNWLFLSSLGKTPLEGQVLGAASAAADVLKALLPFFIAWSWQARRYVPALAGSSAFAFFAAFSLLSAIGFAADNRGVFVQQRDELTAAYGRMQDMREYAERQRKTLPAHRSAAIVSEEIEAHRQHRRWTATNSCTAATASESREYCAMHFKLRSELAAAKEADRLADEIDGLDTELARLRAAGAGQEGDPQVLLLSRISRQEKESIRLALVMAVALLVEIGASLGLFLASEHGVRAKSANDGRDDLGAVEDFSLEALVPSRSATLTPHDLLRGYRQWCAGSDRTPLYTEAFESVFAALAAAVGIPRAQGGWRGIELKKPPLQNIKV